MTKVIVDRLDETVTHTTYGFAGKRQTIHGFDQIKQFYLIEDKDSEGDLIWSLGIKFLSGKTVEISSLASHNEKYKRDFVFEINEFIYKQMLAFQTVLELEDESNRKIG